MHVQINALGTKVKLITDGLPFPWIGTNGVTNASRIDSARSTTIVYVIEIVEEDSPALRKVSWKLPRSICVVREAIKIAGSMNFIISS